MRAKLTVLHGTNKGKTILIAKPQYVVGRSEKCQLRLNHEAISRQHCAFLLSPDKIVLRDLGSRNGTLLNGEKINKQAEIKTGDRIQFGPLEFSVQILDQEGKVVKASEAKPDAEAASGDSGIISDWLSDAEGPRAKEDSTATTRMFKFDAPASNADEINEEKTQTIQDSDTKKIPSSKKKKSEPGKLPTQKKQTDIGENTQEAAAETLRRIFTRGS
jgi:pSer/pThr/pTyr-binding forkhead associated (FHA) protein